MLSAAKCHTLQGNWEAALKAAEFVLDKEPKNCKAILVKAEGLFNLCQFELALVFFHRGQALSPDLESFRLGIQKCRRTIQETVKDNSVFAFNGVLGMFSILRRNADIQDQASSGSAAFDDRQALKNAQKDYFGVMNVAKKFKTNLKKATEKKEEQDVKQEARDEEETDKKTIKSVLNKHRELSDESEEQEAPMINLDRPNAQSDRLAKDKAYLITLTERLVPRLDLAYDVVQKSIKRTTYETLDYLKKREQFWEQLELRRGESGIKHVESYRWLM